MRKLLQVAILGACVVCGKSGAYVLTGSDVYRLMDGSAEDKAFVVGCVQGFSEAWGTYEVGLEESGVPPLLFCIPDGIKAIPLHTSPRLAELSGVAGALDKDGYLLQAQP